MKRRCFRGNNAFLRFKIDFIEELGLEKLRDADLKSLTQLMNNPQLDGIIGAVDDIADGGFGNAAAHEELVLGHLILGKQFQETYTHRLIQLHSITARLWNSLTTIILEIGRGIVPVAELLPFTGTCAMMTSTLSEKKLKERQQT